MATQELDQFAVEFARDGCEVVVRVAGDVDCASAPTLRSALGGVIEEQGNLFVRVDLGAVTFIDSSGLTALVQALKTAQDKGGEVTLANPRPSTRRVLEIVGFSQVFRITPDDEPGGPPDPAGTTA